jgi:hypothetical protein
MRKVTSHLSRDMRATLDDEFIVMDDMDDNGDYDNSDSICNINDIHINNSVNRDGDAESDVRELENTVSSQFLQRFLICLLYLLTFILLLLLIFSN